MKATRLFKSFLAPPTALTTTSRQAQGLSRRSFFTATRPTTQPKTPHRTAPSRPLPLFFSSHLPRRIRFKSTKPNGQAPKPTEELGSPEPVSLSAKLKKLSREYGYSAVAVYFGLSLLDFPFCFLAVRLIGTDRIGHYEHVIVEGFWRVIRVVLPDAGKNKGDKIVDTLVESDASAEERRTVAAREGIKTKEVEAAEKAGDGSDASIWTQLALAYAVHKSLIFFRVPLAVAVTPKVVKQLRAWGWNVGNKVSKTSKATPS